MQVEAIYRHGTLEFVKPLRLKRDHFHLMVVVPDEAVESSDPTSMAIPPAIMARAQALLEKFDAIRRASLQSGAQLPQLGIEYEERLEAMDIRAEIRREQGRPT